MAGRVYTNDQVDARVALDVLAAVNRGDFSVRMPADWTGEAGRVAEALDAIIESNQRLERELALLSKRAGREGQVERAPLAEDGDAWSGKLDSLNELIENLVRPNAEMGRIIRAVAAGDLSQTVPLEIDGRPLEGQFLDTARTVNTLVDQLNAFANEVTRVAREVGVEGRLGGQANVPGAYGTWRDLTDNVNRLSATLTTQVRAIADVATAVTEGDLTRSIGVEASGEVAVLKDKINEMILNLRQTTQKTKEQDWLKTNLARFARMLQGQRDLHTVTRMIMSELAPLVNADHGAFFIMNRADGDEPRLSFEAGYAYKPRRGVANEYAIGEGLVGQCAVDRRRILLANVPPDYVKVSSGLGEGTPFNILILPVLFEGDVRAVIELASLQAFSEIHQDYLDQLMDSIGAVLNNIEASSRTEGLLLQSQTLANELQSQQGQLRRTNAELEEKANQLAQQNSEIEQKRREVEEAKDLLEEKAEQLAVTSRYKSEFLANMSHELRTPLNSLLILAQELAENPDGNLLPKQVEYATIIRSSGSDLLKLINDILDLSKIESGTVTLEISDWPLSGLEPLLERTFRHVAEVTELDFAVELDSHLPKTIPTDPQRLQQILNNLLSNAFKFTEKGKIEFRAAPAVSGWTLPDLNSADGVVALTVADTGIGIPVEMQRSIFEAFAQGDGTTSRKYGGTGLGLSICRELVTLLGGEITLRSEPGRGSAFTVYLPSGSIPSPRRRTDDEQPETDEAVSPIWRPGRRELAPIGAMTAGPLLRETAPVAVERRVRRRREVSSNGGPDAGIGGSRKVLVVDDDLIRREQVLAALQSIDAEVVGVTSGEEALGLLGRTPINCVVVDLGLPGVGGWEVIDHVRARAELRSVPLVVYTARNLTRKEEMRLGRATRSIVIREVRSTDRLREEVTHLVDQHSEPSAGSAGTGHHDPLLADRKVLVVDDDIRNIFALTAMLERQGMRVVAVDNGGDAIRMAREAADVEIALIDVMMPEMDGYATMRRMRELATFRDQPIIALTAKAMKGDREKCIEAGASDYIAKPVNSEHLLSMLRAWLSS
jgi:signal transduction histidine kinase/DNA-binding response OmpR family regulator/HAMP domain-containing protein